jgi:hypothetical protein
MQITECLGGTHKMGFVDTITGVYSLRTLKQEEARSGAVIRLDERYVDATGVRNDSGDVHWQWMNPFLVNRKDVDDKIRGSFGAVNRTVFPRRR